MVEVEVWGGVGDYTCDCHPEVDYTCDCHPEVWSGAPVAYAQRAPHAGYLRPDLIPPDPMCKILPQALSSSTRPRFHIYFAKFDTSLWCRKAIVASLGCETYNYGVMKLKMCSALTICSSAEPKKRS